MVRILNKTYRHQGVRYGGQGSVLYSEALSTPTCALDIGVVENELASEFGLHVVHLCAQYGQLSLGVYEQPSTCRK